MSEFGNRYNEQELLSSAAILKQMFNHHVEEIHPSEEKKNKDLAQHEQK